MRACSDSKLTILKPVQTICSASCLFPAQSKNTIGKTDPDATAGQSKCGKPLDRRFWKGVEPMAKNVKVIQATSPILSAQSQLSVKKRRVAAW